MRAFLLALALAICGAAAGFAQAAPGPDLWVTKSDETDYFCNDPDPSRCAFDRLHVTYKFAYGNRGNRPASGVMLVDYVPEVLRLGIGTGGWACAPDLSGRQICVLRVSDLPPGSSATATLQLDVTSGGQLVERGTFNQVRISDDRSNGVDRSPADNLGEESTVGTACENPLERAICCVFAWLADGATTPTAPGARAARARARRSVADRARAVVGRIFETAEDLHLFYRVRENVFQRTPGGRRAIDLYYAHTTEITRLLAASPALVQQALDTLELWQPHLEALVAGGGVGRTVRTSELAAVRSLLDNLADAGSPALRQTIERESAAIGLASFAGLTLDQGLARLNRFSCAPDDNVLCLDGGRFRVEAVFETAAGATGRARTQPLTADTGYFWFFAPENVETIVKVIDGCGFNSRQWVFAAGLTNVEVTTTVTDTETGAIKTYSNPLGRPFRPIQDTGAFASCP